MSLSKIKSKFHKLLHPGDRTPTDRKISTSGSPRNSTVQDDFPYEPLELCNEFRFLTLLPGSGDEEIECELSTHRLDFEASSDASDHNINYEALSYTWGSLKDMQCIKLNGRGKLVTKTLHSALLHLRDSTTSRVLWVDAVCINQNNLQERSYQVLQMGMLYRFAKQVVAWIGEGDGETSFCITLANVLSKILRGEVEGEDADLVAMARWAFGLKDRTPLNTEKRDKRFVSLAWHGYDELLTRAWFRRVWIVQEVTLASTVIIQCGKIWIDFEMFYLAILKSSVFREENKLTTLGESHGWTSLMGIGRLRGELSGPADNYPELLHLLSRFTYSEATDDRDRIYSFLGITHP